jgi:hypothetical protein
MNTQKIVVTLGKLFNFLVFQLQHTGRIMIYEKIPGAVSIFVCNQLPIYMFFITTNMHKNLHTLFLAVSHD